jgi:hypothetical protein
MDDEKKKLYSSPKSSKFHDFFLHYFSIFEAKKDLNEYVKIPVEIIEPDGFFIYAVGFPSDEPDQTRAECYFADAESDELQHITLRGDLDLTGPFFDQYFQDRAFIKQIWWELKLKGYMKNTFLRPEWFVLDPLDATDFDGRRSTGTSLTREKPEADISEGSRTSSAELVVEDHNPGVLFKQSVHLFDELREDLIEKLELAGDYLYPETENCNISGVFTKEPDFGILRKISEHASEKGRMDYDGPWSADDLYNFLKQNIDGRHNGDRYYIHLSFGGILPILTLVPFLTTFSCIDSFGVTFTRDKWEARGDYYKSEHIGMKLQEGRIVVDIFEEDDDFDDESAYGYQYDQHAAEAWMK